MRVEQVYRQSLQMARFVTNRCHTPNSEHGLRNRTFCCIIVVYDVSYTR